MSGDGKTVSGIRFSIRIDVTKGQCQNSSKCPFQRFRQNIQPLLVPPDNCAAKYLLATPRRATSRVSAKTSSSNKRCVGSWQRCAVEEVLDGVLIAADESIGKLPIKSSSISFRTPDNCEPLAVIDVVRVERDDLVSDKDEDEDVGGR